jgi:hypothetical protein
MGTAAIAVAFGASGGCESEGGEAAAPAGPGAGGSTTGGGMGGDVFVGSGGSVPCAEPCPAGNVCSHDVCVPSAPCQDDNECQYDTYCDPAAGCQPWEQKNPAHDPNCVQVAAVGVLAPKIQCSFEEAPAGDPFPGHVDVQGTPIVVNVSTDPAKPDQVGPGPSVVAASFTVTIPNNYSEHQGVIRVLDGKSCALIANLGGVDLDTPPDGVVDWTVSSASLATGDLDGDGVAEIVAFGADGSTLAFTFKAGSWGLFWKAPYPAGAIWSPCDVNAGRCSHGWAGPSIHDLDDDGKPEVIREAVVFSSTGALLALQPADYQSHAIGNLGLFPVLANLDPDPPIELTNGHFVWQWSAGGWQKESYFPGGSPSAPGLVAVADLGAFGATLPPNAPEIVVVRGGQVVAHALTGEIVQPPTAVPGGGSGGPPTVADFDGDKLPEVGVAALGAYTVYDIDCGPTPRPGGICPPGKCDLGPCPSYVAWSRQTQDLSSSVTGSSVFDFEADGRAEVVYGDECFLRVYDGSTGDVVFSQFRSSCTWFENPIVADVDGDFRAEIVVPSNKACSATGQGKDCSMLNADGVDVQFNGLRCDDAGDCASGVCDAGLCRCTSTAQCCAANDDAACLAQGHKCAAPDPGTPGSGNTCRAAHPTGVSGIRIYSDANDQWVSSRRIWSQHAYAVTHVNENGTVPKASAWKNNWDDPKLDNFRQNVPGSANGQAVGDATAGASKSFECAGDVVKLLVAVCNRGALPIGAGMPVGFYVGDTKICGAATTVALAPEECEIVACEWQGPPTDESNAVDVTVIADDGNTTSECKEGNNKGGVFDVYCKPPT